MTRKIIGIVFFILAILLFCYFRLKPIYFQTVGYTYDQGRDFLKAAEIVLDKNPTFIGPTTGIQGVFHGAWYYYLLLIPFFIFSGAPIGFYYFNFLLQLVSFIILIIFVNKYFGYLSALIISFMVATSPYFIFTSAFVGNNIFVLPFFLLFLIINFLLIESKNKKSKLFFLVVGLLLGIISEFELAFGIFLIPSYLILVFFSYNLRRFFVNKKSLLFFLLGLFTVFIPRLLFELKNNFSQTRVLFNFLSNAGRQNPQTYSQIFQERLNLFFGYFNSLFLNDLILKIFILFFIFIFYFFFENKIKKYNRSLQFFSLLLILLFFLSTLNKADFFWGNYYEGIQYLFIIVLVLILAIQTETKNNILTFFKISFFIILLISSFNDVLRNFNNKQELKGTLKQHVQLIDYIFANENNKNNYCVKIYTPPVIPFTY